jgi:hypothetical protein
VGDGLCDCCDGSDEAPGVCTSVCEALAAEARRADAARREAWEKGSKLRQVRRGALPSRAWPSLMTWPLPPPLPQERVAQAAEQATSRMARHAEALDRKRKLESEQSGLLKQLVDAERRESARQAEVDAEYALMRERGEADAQERAFAKLDLNGDGAVSSDDLRRQIGELSHALKAIVDQDKDGTVSEPELLSVLDLDGSGDVAAHEDALSRADFIEYVWPMLEEAFVIKREVPDDLRLLTEAAAAARDAVTKVNQSVTRVSDELSKLVRAARVDRTSRPLAHCDTGSGRQHRFWH